MSVTNCTDIAEDLTLHAAGEPAPRVEAHLAACPACRARHAELLALCGALHALRDPEPVIRFNIRRALWPLAIAASVLVVLWPAAPARRTAPIPSTWFALQRAALNDDGTLEAALAKQAADFTASLQAAPAAGFFTLAQLEP